MTPQVSELFESALAKTSTEEPLAAPTLQSNAAVKEAAVPAATPTGSDFAFAPLAKRSTEPLFEPKPEAEKLSEDPVLTEIDKDETGEIMSPAPVLSSLNPARPSPAKPKNGGELVSVLVLLIIGAGSYAAWMYVPAFRTIVQPEIDGVMALAGKPPAARPQPKPVLLEPSAPVAASPVSAPIVSPNQTPASSTSPTPASTPAAAARTAAATPDAPASSTIETKSAPAVSIAAKSAAVGSNADSDTPTRTISLENPPPMDKGVIILSSKGAEKRLLDRVAPVYPKEARTAGVEGTVVLKVLINDTGKVADASLVEGDQTLGKAAIQAVKQWHYRPYARDGKDLPFQTIVMLNFQQK
jgi:protein TonB